MENVIAQIEHTRKVNSKMRTSTDLLHREILKIRINQYTRKKELNTRKQKINEYKKTTDSYRKAVVLLKLSHKVEKMSQMRNKIHDHLHKYELQLNNIENHNYNSEIDEIRQKKTDLQRKRDMIIAKLKEKADALEELKKIEIDTEKMQNEVNLLSQKKEFLENKISSMKNAEEESYTQEETSEISPSECSFEEDAIENDITDSLFLKCDEFDRRSSELHEYENIITEFESDWEELKADDIYSYEAKMQKLNWLLDQSNNANTLLLQIDDINQKIFDSNLKLDELKDQRSHLLKINSTKYNDVVERKLNELKNLTDRRIELENMLGCENHSKTLIDTIIEDAQSAIDEPITSTKLF